MSEARYTVRITRVESNPAFDPTRHGTNYGYGPHPSPTIEVSSLTFECDETIFAAIRKAAVESMP